MRRALPPCEQTLTWIASGAAWIECRQLRNFMIHEYVRDSTLLASALTRGHEAVGMLTASAQNLAGLVLGDAIPLAPK